MLPTLAALAAFAAAALIATFCYAAWCYVNPFGTCLACRLTPGDPLCTRCGGTRRRLRIGWQIANALTGTWRDAYRDPPATATSPTQPDPTTRTRKDQR